MNARKVALVIGSGGIKCAAAVGVMDVLVEAGIGVDMVVGCSGGAVFGAAIALGSTPRQMEEIRSRTWQSDLVSRRNYRKIASILAPKILGFDESFAIFDDRIMNRHLGEAFGAETTFADTKIPFYVVATNFYSGQKQVISTGRIVEALRCSSGIPLVFGARAWGDTMLIDGALSDPLPVDVAIREGADLIFAVGFETPMSGSVSSIGEFSSQMFNILINQLMLKKLAFYNLAHHSEVFTIIPHFDRRIGVGDVHLVPEIIARGAEAMRQHIPYLNKLLAA